MPAVSSGSPPISRTFGAKLKKRLRPARLCVIVVLAGSYFPAGWEWLPHLKRCETGRRPPFRAARPCTQACGFRPAAANLRHAPSRAAATAYPMKGGNFVVFEKVRTILCDQLDADEDSITMDTDLVEDLGADSLDVVDLVMSLEEEFDIEIPDEDAEGIRTGGRCGPLHRKPHLTFPQQAKRVPYRCVSGCPKKSIGSAIDFWGQPFDFVRISAPRATALGLVVAGCVVVRSEIRLRASHVPDKITQRDSPQSRNILLFLLVWGRAAEKLLGIHKGFCAFFFVQQSSAA